MIETGSKLVMGALLVAAAPVAEPSVGQWAQWGLAAYTTLHGERRMMQLSSR